MAAEGWRTVALGEVAQLDIDRVAVQPDDDYEIAGVLIAGRGLFRRETIKGAETNYPNLHRLRAGQLVYRKLTAWEGPITVVPPDFEGTFVSSEFPTFTLDETQMLPEFMRILCQRPGFHDEMRLWSTGTAERRNRLKPSDLLDVEIELPPLDEQRRIIDAVGAAGDAEAAADAERKAAFTALTTAVETLLVPGGSWDDLPDGWELRKLGHVADVRSGITKGRKTDKEMRPFPFLRAANVQNGYLDLSEIKTIEVTVDEVDRFRLEDGDVLMVEGSGSTDRLGRGWVWEGEIAKCLHQNHVFRARPDSEQIEPRFLAYAIAADPAREHFRSSAKTTSGLSTINKTQTAALPVPVPPIKAQRDITEKLDSLRRAAVTAHRAHDRLVRLRESLAEALLSGERRVRETLAA